MKSNQNIAISVIIPTYNEGDRTYRLVGFINQFAAGIVCETIVADAASTDNTCQQATLAGARVIQCSTKGRASQMNAGAKVAKGNVLYFVHADVELLPTFTSDIKEALAQNYQAGCYRYIFDSNKRILKINAYFTRFKSLMCRGGDQTLFVTKAVFNELSGYNEYYAVMEEYDFIRRLSRKHSFRIIPKNVIVSARKYDRNSWLRVQLVNLFTFIMFFLGRNPLDIKKTYSKLLNYP